MEKDKHLGLRIDAETHGKLKVSLNLMDVPLMEKYCI